MPARSVIAGAAATLVTAAAVAAAGAGDASSTAGANGDVGAAQSEVVLVDTSRGTATLDAATGKWSRGPDGVVVPGSSVLVSAAESGGRTRISTRDLVAGRQAGGPVLAGDLVTTVVSGSGRLAALTQPRSEGATPWLPVGRRTTRLVVVPTAGGGNVKKFHLLGNFEPEAFSTDDETLFLIEYAPAMAPSHYSVRRLNLKTGRVAPIARLKLAAPGVMRGTGRMQVLAPDQSQLYTLYTQQGPNYAHGSTEQHEPGRVHAFVHVLDLTERWAHCIDLPMPFGTGRATASAVAVSPTGDRLYVSDWTNGVIATIDPSRVRVLDVHEVALGGRDDATFAAATEDVLYVAGNTTVAAFDVVTMELIARTDAGAEVVGLRVAPDTDTLYVATADGMSVWDARLTEAVRSWPASGVDGLLNVFETESEV